MCREMTEADVVDGRWTMGGQRGQAEVVVGTGGSPREEVVSGETTRAEVVDQRWTMVGEVGQGEVFGSPV